MHAHNAGQVARIRCGYCSIKRFYKPLELREVIGNVSIDQVRAKVRCEKCGRKESVDAELFHPVGQELVTIRFRRLVEIRWRSASSGKMSDLSAIISFRFGMRV